MKKLVYLFAFVLITIGCTEKKQSSSTKLNVVVTTGMIADAVENIAGEIANVQSLMGPSVDPHLYKATANDTKKLANANLIFYNGLHLEGKMESIFQKMRREKAVHAITEDIPHKYLLSPDGMEDVHDPHIWFDVSLWQQAVKKITSVLQSIDKNNADVYKKNSEAYLKKLDKLHSWTKEQINTIPKESRVLITSHDAFGYLGNAYEVEVMGLQGISTVTESGVQDIERIIKVINSRKVKAIFEETSIVSKGLTAVFERTGVKIGGKLFSDAMGERGTKEGTYIGMVEHNVKTIVKALTGK